MCSMKADVREFKRWCIFGRCLRICGGWRSHDDATAASEAQATSGLAILHEAGATVNSF